ncbi:MAG: hypothetical protein ACRDNY_05395 [Gaiellaceae bacterium]
MGQTTHLLRPAAARMREIARANVETIRGSSFVPALTTRTGGSAVRARETMAAASYACSPTSCRRSIRYPRRRARR